MGGSNTVLVRDLMSTEVTTVRRNDALSMADEIMALGRIRHLPVVDDDDETRVVGVVSQRDMFRGALAKALGYGAHAQDRVLAMLVVKEVMTDPAVTTTPETTLGAASKRMLEAKVGCLPVVDGDRLVGILTESDFVRRFADG